MNTAVEVQKPFDPKDSPWPQMRRERIKKLLPTAMKLADVNAWVVVGRENASDPLAKHIGGENAGGTAAFLFQRQGDEIKSIAITPWGEANGLKDMNVHDEFIVLEQPTDVWKVLAEQLKAIPGQIAVNSSAANVADGLSWTQRQAMEEAMDADTRDRLVSSETLVAEWLSVKLPEEIEIIRRAGALTVQIEQEAYATIVPGKTRDCDVAAFIKKRMDELGVENGWSPEQNPSVQSGFPRGHAGPTDKVIIPGDFIQTDFGIKVYDTWCTDYQRFAYVLEPGQTQAPPEAVKKWEIARKGHRIALAAMKPGVRGYDVDRAQREWMEENGSLPVKWGTGHPVGYWAHDIGPGLTGGQRPEPPANALRLLRPGQLFAFDGFFAWEEERPYGKGEKCISVEEIGLVTEDGAEYLIPPQEELILIPSR